VARRPQGDASLYRLFSRESREFTANFSLISKGSSWGLTQGDYGSAYGPAVISNDPLSLKPSSEPAPIYDQELVGFCPNLLDNYSSFGTRMWRLQGASI
jgi:hypothetical protein